MFGVDTMEIDFNNLSWEKQKEIADDENVNWKQMYLQLFNAVSDAVEILNKAQQKCEEMYIERD